MHRFIEKGHVHPIAIYFLTVFDSSVYCLQDNPNMFLYLA